MWIRSKGGEKLAYTSGSSTLNLKEVPSTLIPETLLGRAF